MIEWNPLNFPWISANRWKSKSICDILKTIFVWIKDIQLWSLLTKCENFSIIQSEAILFPISKVHEVFNLSGHCMFLRSSSNIKKWEIRFWWEVQMTADFYKNVNYNFYYVDIPLSFFDYLFTSLLWIDPLCNVIHMLKSSGFF